MVPFDGSVVDIIFGLTGVEVVVFVFVVASAFVFLSSYRSRRSRRCRRDHLCCCCRLCRCHNLTEILGAPRTDHVCAKSAASLKSVA